MVIGTSVKKLGLSGLIQGYMGYLKRLRVTLNGRVDHFVTYIRNQETKLYQNQT